MLVTHLFYFCILNLCSRLSSCFSLILFYKQIMSLNVRMVNWVNQMINITEVKITLKSLKGIKIFFCAS